MVQWSHLDLEGELGIIHMMSVLQIYKIKKVLGVYANIFRKTTEAMCWGILFSGV